MNLSRAFSGKVLSSHSTVKHLLQPLAILQSSLYSTSSSTGKPRYSKKPVKSDVSESIPKSQDQHLEIPSNPNLPEKKIISSFEKYLPMPTEIPWQTKIVNSVNFIGSVSKPVQSQESPDGNFWAGTVLTRENVWDSTPLWIPIIFEGDLAHLAVCHLKEKDLIHVVGELSGDPPQVSMQHGQSSIQVLVHSITFVQESHQEKVRYTPYKKDEEAEIPEKEVEEVGKERYTTYKKDEEAEKERYTPYKKVEGAVNVSANTVRSKESVDTFWRDLINNPDKWLDYRKKKLNKMVNPRHPDFKHRDSGQALWLSSAPKWALPGIQIFDNKDEEYWKDLVENPGRWWDNRPDKSNERAPDFKHKDTGKALWLGDSPTWVGAKLPPLKPKVDSFRKTDTLLS